jgi:hypothetical protein
MGTYATVEGQIVYKDKALFDAALKFLIEGHWVKPGGDVWVDERGIPIAEQDDLIDTDALAIAIPCFLYRDLAGHIKTLFIGGKGEAVATSGSLDEWQGFVITSDGGNYKEQFYDLNKWAAENINEPAPSDTDSADYRDWADGVEIEFHAEFAP